MPDHKTFCAFGAYAVNVVDPHTTVVMLLANASDLRKIDKSKIAKLNLQQRLGIVHWDEVILDTMGLHRDGEGKSAAPAYPPDDGINVLTVGPLFPGQHIGGIYMERSKFFTEIRPILDPDPDPRNPNERQWPHPGLHTYQVMSSASRVGNTISRYHGFHAKVRASEGSLKILDVNGTRIRVDMNDRTQCDDPVVLAQDVQDPDRRAATETVLDAGSRPNDEGAIFLPLTLCAVMALVSPKEPPGADGLTGGSHDPPAGSRTKVVAVLNPRRTGVSARVARKDSSGTFVNVGAPDSDLFTRSVFDHCFTNARVRAPVLESTDVPGLRGRLMAFVSNLKSSGDSLDIIADAPGGIQRIGKSTLPAIMGRLSVNDKMAGLLRARFARCRLLGCVTALDLDARKRMLELASLLGIPVIGTLRAIAFPDFDDTSFVDTQRIGDQEVSIVLSTDQMTSSGNHHKTVTEDMITSGIIQREWLRGFDQVEVVPDDLEGDVPLDARNWQMPDDLLESRIAATDKIHTSAAGTVALHTPSGAIRCDVLAAATLLRLKSKTHGLVYVNIPPTSDRRRTLLSLISA